MYALLKEMWYSPFMILHNYNKYFTVLLISVPQAYLPRSGHTTPLADLVVIGQQRRPQVQYADLQSELVHRSPEQQCIAPPETYTNTKYVILGIDRMKY